MLVELTVPQLHVECQLVELLLDVVGVGNGEWTMLRQC